MPVQARSIRGAAIAPLPDGEYMRRTAPPPLVPISLDGALAPIWCKLEFLHPSGSTKDRIAAHILAKAWREGLLSPGARVIEASSGSTSIALAMVCAQMGLRFTAVMPASVSNERILMIKAYGAQVELSPAGEGMCGALRRAKELAECLQAFRPRQFENPDNVAAHRFGTAREILSQIPNGSVDAVVSGVGTGGTLVGLFAGMLDQGCKVTPVAARPVMAATPRAGAPTSARGAFGEVECCSFSSRIPGVVENLTALYRPQEMPGLVEIDVDDELALQTTRALIGKGFPVGPSSGLNLAAALEFQRRCDRPAAIVTVFPDRMERYFSTELFAPVRPRAE
ncbi:MAG TPA: cysteine synthase family protein [Steroidobacteraceae bacterium]